MKKFPMGDIHRISRQTCDKTIYIISLKCSLHEIFYIHIFQHKCIEQKGQKTALWIICLLHWYHHLVFANFLKYNFHGIGWSWAALKQQMTAVSIYASNLADEMVRINRISKGHFHQGGHTMVRLYIQISIMSIYFKITPAVVYCYWSISYKTYSLRPLKNKTKPKKKTKQNKTKPIITNTRMSF